MPTTHPGVNGPGQIDFGSQHQQQPGSYTLVNSTATQMPQQICSILPIQPKIEKMEPGMGKQGFLKCIKPY